MIVVELRALEVFGNHGVYEEERARGQAFLYDLWLSVPDAAGSDRLEDTVDYDAVAKAVAEVSAERRYGLLEALATGLAAQVVQERCAKRRERQ